MIWSSNGYNIVVIWIYVDCSLLVDDSSWWAIQNVTGQKNLAILTKQTESAYLHDGANVEHTHTHTIHAHTCGYICSHLSS